MQRLAIQRDEEAIENWKMHQLPWIKKRRELKAWLVLEDESGFSLVSPLRSSWAPCGQTPSTYTSLDHHQRLNLLGAILVSPSG